MGMNTSHNDPTRSQHEHDDVTVVDLLITRLLDGEATADDVIAFSNCVREDANAKDELRLIRSDQSIVNAYVSDEIANAACVDLPMAESADARRSLPLISVFWKGAAVAGWAAAIALTFATLFSQSGAQRQDGGNSSSRLIDRKAVEPHIIQRETKDELEPLAVQTQKLPDGRWQITWMRRYLEVVTSDRFEPEWVRDEPVD